jgi:Putative transposase
LQREEAVQRNPIQTGAVAFIHRFGSSLNKHVHFHVCVIDGVFETSTEGVQFYEAAPLAGEQIEQAPQVVRRRLLPAFVGRGYLDKSDAKAMLGYELGGGFSVNASVRIGAQDRSGLERLLRYCARAPFAGQRVRIEGDQVVYRCPKAPAGEQKVGVEKRDHGIEMSPLEFIARIAALIPPPRLHRHRYYTGAGNWQRTALPPRKGALLQESRPLTRPMRRIEVK